MATAKQVFAALPYVNEVWITSDGNHHLHGGCGGEKVTRGEEIKEQPAAESKKAQIKK